jgi:chitodextrinase
MRTLAAIAMSSAAFAVLAFSTTAARGDVTLPTCVAVFSQQFSAFPNPALTGQAVAFDGSCSNVRCPAFGGFNSCPPENYAWSFGDGTTLAGPSKTSHAYSAAGTYTVTLTMEDYNGNDYTVTHQVTVL